MFSILSTICLYSLLSLVDSQLTQVLSDRQCRAGSFFQLGVDINSTLEECFSRCIAEQSCEFAQHNGAICQLLRFCSFTNGPGSGFNIYIRNASMLNIDSYTRLTTNGRCKGVPIQQDNKAVSLTGCIYLCSIDNGCEYFQFNGSTCLVYSFCLLEENRVGFQVYRKSPILNPQCNGQGSACSTTESHGRCCRSLECRVDRFPSNGINYTCQNAGQFRDISPPAGVLYTVHAVNKSCIGQQLVGDTNLDNEQECIDLCSYNPDCAYVTHVKRTSGASCSLSATSVCQGTSNFSPITILRKRLDCLGDRGLCTKDDDCCDDRVCLSDQDKYHSSRCGNASLRPTVKPDRENSNSSEGLTYCLFLVCVNLVLAGFKIF